MKVERHTLITNESAVFNRSNGLYECKLFCIQDVKRAKTLGLTYQGSPTSGMQAENKSKVQRETRTFGLTRFGTLSQTVLGLNLGWSFSTQSVL